MSLCIRALTEEKHESQRHTITRIILCLHVFKTSVVFCLSMCKVMGCLHDPANVQQSMCILNTFARSLLDVCWIV